MGTNQGQHVAALEALCRRQGAARRPTRRRNLQDDNERDVCWRADFRRGQNDTGSKGFRRPGQKCRLSYFEFGTLAGVCGHVRSRVDDWILEVWSGGRTGLL